MHKHCSNVCKLHQCLDKESKISARMRTIVTAALQRQYSQTELTFWKIYVYVAPSKDRNLTSYIYGQDFYWGFCFLNRLSHVTALRHIN
jgi:hypothetical protein